MKKQLLKPGLIFLFVFLQIQLKAQNFADAIGLSHAGRYGEAEQIFSKLIGNDEKNTSLLIASGFNNAWNKDYAAAKRRFQRALELEPSNTDAAKGLAYTYLYKGDFTKAARAFERLSAAHFNTEEFHFALGLSYMNLQKESKADVQFRKVLEINKTSAEAGKRINEIRSGRGLIELSAMGGLSGADGESQFGLRQVQAGYHISHQTFIYARYDNSLAQDNYFFLKSKFNSNAFIGGVYTRWHYRVGSKFEYMYRSLPGKIQQHIYQTEQVIFLPKNFAFKFGGSVVNTTRQQNEWMLMSGLSVPAGKKIQIEPYYYYMKRLTREHRMLLNVSYHFNPKNDIAVGIFNGSEKNNKANINHDVFGIYAYSNFLIAGPLSGIILTRYEKDAFDRKFFIAAAGLKLTLDTKKF